MSDRRRSRQEVMSPVSTTIAPNRLAVFVLYNGLTESIDYEPHEHGQALFEQACSKFQIPAGQRADLALYLPDNTTEVPLGASIEQGGVQPNTTLTLRPRRSSGA